MTDYRRGYAIIRKTLFQGEESFDVEATFDSFVSAENYLLKLQNEFVNQGRAKEVYWTGRDSLHLWVSDVGMEQDDVVWDFKIISTLHYDRVRID